MAKQIITLEITFSPEKATRAHAFRTWIHSYLMSTAKWITKVEVINESPVYWSPDDKVDDLNWVKAHIGKGWDVFGSSE